MDKAFFSIIVAPILKCKCGGGWKGVWGFRGGGFKGRCAI